MFLDVADNKKQVDDKDLSGIYKKLDLAVA
jgi:hypothetical protein